MAHKRVAATILVCFCLIAVLSSVERSEARQNCFCECVSHCLSLVVMTSEKCAEGCDNACTKIGFPGIPQGGVEFCEKSRS